MNDMSEKLERAITELKAANIELQKDIEKKEEIDEMRKEFISNVSHDLKTPLTSMVGYIELLKKEELSPVCQDYVNVISSRAEKLKEMIESLFSLAKASSGNIELHKEVIDMNRLIEQIFADMEDKIYKSGLTFVKQLSGEDTRLVTDNAHMYRICQNLIENALKYSAKGTRVFVKTFVQPALINWYNCGIQQDISHYSHHKYQAKGYVMA